MEPVLDRTALGLATKQAMIDLDFSQQDKNRIKALLLKKFEQKFPQFVKFHNTQCPQTMMLEGRYLVQNQYPINNQAYQYYRVLAYDVHLGNGQYLGSSRDKNRRKITVIEGYSKTENRRKFSKTVSKPKSRISSSPSQTKVKIEAKTKPSSSTSLPKHSS